MNQKIRLKIGENEIELEGDEKFVEKQLKSFLDSCEFFKIAVSKEKTIPLPQSTYDSSDKTRKTLAPAEYVRQKSPKSGTEKLIVLAKYLEDYESLSEFKSKDITRVAHQAKIGKIDPSYYPLAVKQGLLNKIKHGNYQLTLTGEDAVLSMSAPTPQSK